MPSARRSALTSEYLEIDCPDSEDRPVGMPEGDHLDPAAVAADLMLSHAVRSCGTPQEKLGCNGTVCVLVAPSRAWEFPLMSAWRRSFRGNMSPSWSVAAVMAPTDWYCITARDPDEAPAPLRNRDREHLAQAISVGLHVLATTTAAGGLSPVVVAAADHTLVVPPLTAGDVETVVRTVTRRRPRASFPADLAPQITPCSLRVACRPRQGATAYLSRLAKTTRYDLTSARPVRPGGGVRSRPDGDGDVRAQPSLDRLHGMNAAVAWGRALERDITACRAGTIRWSEVDRGCLLSGPPGCGKTLFARALATSCNADLVTGSYSEWLANGQGHQGDLLKAMRRSFETARQRTPSILFIDEIDSFADRSKLTGRNREWMIEVVNALLAEVDGVQGRDGVVLIGATNDFDRVDPALRRAGRLDRHIRIPRPSRDDLALMLREHLGGDLAGVSLSGAALLADGSSGADCERFVRDARRGAREAGRAMLLDDLIAGIGGVDPRTPTEIRLAALHEAGHVVVADELLPGRLNFVTVRNSDTAGGITAVHPSSRCPTAADLHRQAAVLLAGRAAEQEIVGEVTTAAGGSAASDLGLATTLIARSILSYGMSPKLGPVWLGEVDAGTLDARLLTNPVVAAEVRDVLQAAAAEAAAIVARRRNAVAAVADALVDRIVLDAGEVGEILAGDPASPEYARIAPASDA